MFHSSKKPIGLLTELVGSRIAIGPDGSGTRSVATTLLTENGITGENATLLDASGSAAADALLGGSIDVVFLVGSTEDAAVQKLLAEDSVTLLSFVRSEAYARRHRFLSNVTLPRGSFDPLRDLPPESKRLLAPTAQLLSGEDLHPAIVHLLLDEAEAMFATGDLVQAAQEFPSPRYLDDPLHPIAKRFFKSGRPWLYRVLPFRLAAFCDRMKILLLPLLTLIFPLAKLVPPVYRWRIRSRIYRWYSDLKQLESEAGTRDVKEILDALDELEDEVGRVTVPASYADELYHLKHHVELVRGRVLTHGSAAGDT